MTTLTACPADPAHAPLAGQLQHSYLLQQGGFINGQWGSAAAHACLPVTDPATGQRLATLAASSVGDAREAVRGASAAQAGWAALPARERAALLMAWHAQIIAHADDLALLMTREQGKPLAEARGEVMFGASFVAWYAEEAKRVHGEVLQTYSADRRVLTLRQPVGVVVAITPWNFPSAMITRKCAPALAAGCSIVLKPSEETPLSAIALCVLAQRAGIPDGVINLVLCTRDNVAEVGRALLEDSRVRKLSFTGSTQTGKTLMRLAADNVLKVSLELGGNAPLIVFDDADLDRAADGALASKFRNMGQTCTCANRILVQRSVYEAFAAKLVERVRNLKVGPGTEPGVTQGPLINHQAVQKVQRHVADALAHGARAVLGGKPDARGGLFFQPTVLLDVTPRMRICHEETFGPVAPLMAFDTEEEALALANDSSYGLAGYFYTRDLARALRMAERLELGAVGVNEAVISSEAVPIGGVKQSGIGREGAHHGIDEFLETKQITIGAL
ncbi:succinate-semialdehyde dehydrogenase (NADP(+)) [Bordetella genomosp. 7]|uniref:NAD-dependent succinate-semialdehyde dehydrogenase n=1 Tax=Bordetella TaxID=517 RepID=UPI0004B4B1AC|nr:MULTISPECIES: NAD-dependent succinate-semialdehyde dehydrogenase [Bordetella]OZI21653.1 succinate-semialdehyde dehydrogenase (NADP(+)) [Bordetella genomosp. 7]